MTGASILVMAAENDMLVSLSAALERRGHIPLVARTAQDGLALLDAHGSALVVVALPLPDMTASPLLERLRGHGIIVTGSDNDVKTPIDALDLDSYHLFHATRAEMLVRMQRLEEADAAFARARELTSNAAEHAHLDARRATLRT